MEIFFQQIPFQLNLGSKKVGADLNLEAVSKETANGGNAGHISSEDARAGVWVCILLLIAYNMPAWAVLPSWNMCFLSERLRISEIIFIPELSFLENSESLQRTDFSIFMP